MEVTIFMLSLTVGLVMSAGSSTFEPGCSFVGGQCMYNVKLGHEGQCDKVSSGGTSGGNTGCCDDLTNKYGSLVDDIDKLKIKVDLMSKAMDASNFTIAALEKDLDIALKERDDIVNMLHRKEKELNVSNADIAKMMATSATEIQSLRDDLAKAKNSLQSCQTALGIGTGSITKGTNDDSAYSMTYYNFDREPTGFTYYTNMKLMKKGSSSDTGPRVEHSRGVNSGNYLGIDSQSIALSYTHSTYSTYTAKSGTFLPAENYCIKFWYFMKGNDVINLDVNIEILGDTGYPIFSRAGQSNADKWELAQINIDDEYTKFSFKIDFVMKSQAHRQYSSGGYAFKDVKADIAVDDLYVYNTSCSSLPTHPDGAYQNTVNNSKSYYTFHSTPKTWFDAYDYCRRQGPMSALVSIETKAEQAFLVNTIKHDVVLTTVGQNGFYTSGTDADTEQHFKWTNTGDQKDLGDSFWHLGQPNNVAGKQDCLLMEYPDDEFQWGDVECSTKHPFICETTISA